MDSNNQKSTGKPFPIWIDCYKKLLEPTYRKDEVIIFFNRRPTPKIEKELRQAFLEEGITAPIQIRACKDCGSGLKYIQLWKAKDIHTLISTEGVVATSNPIVKKHGEHYSLNFFNYLPFERDKERKEYKCADSQNDKYDKPKITIAVLDTGIDTNHADERYVWKNEHPDDPECYKGAISGWNFVADEAFPDGKADIFDDDTDKHGSIVSQLIMNQFQDSKAVNSVQLMVLKTHDSKGQGDLFGIICAIHFAVAKGANIINASWGFYYYAPFPNPYFKKLITVILKRKGILFITAAGNQIKEENDIAKEIYSQQHGEAFPDDDLLRNLEFHNFYPACLSFDKNTVLTATTTYREQVSPSQNYSETYVDLGVEADELLKEAAPMKFRLPFPGSPPLISGSSFATAIATGLVGAHCDLSLFNPSTPKNDFLNKIPGIVSGSVALEKEFIKKGRYVKR